MAFERQTGSAAGKGLSLLFRHAGVRMEELTVEALGPFDIGARELEALIVIDVFDPTSQQQVGERLGIDRTTMVAMLDDLEAKDIVSRRPDANDRRRNVIALTEPGRALLRRATAAREKAENALLAPLSAEEGRQLREFLGRVTSRPAE